ncbi:acyl carrier protein [Polynucleobacter asymbioticus]|jgi:acyl carrier protein|uniref:Carrier domain-containing protein n=1 Tax=Polynucleobacter asymbioticus TaxID=576611 RepID=A0AAC9IPN5_9BURK|nr:acyl carrier protein [Polynucleobacter asymbioticus]APB98213.1 hypothetical protein A4F89_02100 [Polynucleobacter asymbioticus]APC00499.1 hypothetical protein AOC25_02105 [Polynucleobacter asymbioticus]
MNYTEARKLVVRGILENPLVFMDAKSQESLTSLPEDVSFKELTMDSLAFMELSIWLQLEIDIELTEVDLSDLGSINALATYLSEV